MRSFAALLAHGADRIASALVRVGLVYLPTDRSVPVDVLAVEAEARGFESLFLGEHSHIPVSRRSPFIMGTDLPDEYTRTLDPLVSLGAAAVRTTSIRLGTCIFLLAQRDAISTAKQVATLDHLSGGRFELGIGFGWNRRGGRPPRRRVGDAPAADGRARGGHAGAVERGRGVVRR